MLTCKEATLLMSNEMNERLALGERIRLRLHLFACTGCTNYRHDMTVLRNACRDVVTQTLDDTAD
jgi:hypothetical protein